MDSNVILTCGTFDLFHIGHLNFLKNASNMGTKLIVGISNDFLNFTKKNKFPIIPLHERIQIIKSLQCVDDVFIEDDISIESKCIYMHRYSANVFVIGDDWLGKFDDLPILYNKKHNNVQITVKYIPRTKCISTTQIIQQICVDDKYDNSSLYPCASKKLLNTHKNDLKCILICREQPHQAVHLLPYYYLFKPQNVCWFIDVENTQSNTITIIETFIGVKMENIVTRLCDIEKLCPDVCFITESWLPYIIYIKSIFCKLIFIDHGICVGTRSNAWFANPWHGLADKIYVAGNLQKNHHNKCKGQPKCHNMHNDNIITIGHPRISLFNNLQNNDRLWNINKLDSHDATYKKILFLSTTLDNKLDIFCNIIVRICSKYIVMIRSHPSMIGDCKYDKIIQKTINECIKYECAHRLIIIPPTFPVFTPNLLYDCDLLIMDKSSMGYEYLLFNKPGIIIGNDFYTDLNPTLYLADAFPIIHIIDDLTHNFIDYVISDPDEYKNKRNLVRDNVFIDTTENWINYVQSDLQL